MSSEHRTEHRWPAATPLAALCAALFVVFALVAPVLATEGPTGLSNPAVSPRTGSSSTTISFAVTYRNHEGSSPDHVSVIVDGKAHTMASSGSTDWKHGVRYHWSTRLTIGTHAVSFVAVDREKFTTKIAGGSVTITAPASPTPTPKPTPQPDPTPTPAPTTAPDATPTPGDPGTGGAGSGVTDGGGPSADPTAGADGTGAGVADPTGPGGLDGPAWTGGTVTSGGDPGAGSGSGGLWSDGSGDGSGRSADSMGAGSSGLAGFGPIDSTEGGRDGSAGGTGTADPGSGDSATGAGNAGDVETAGPGWGAVAGALQALGIERPPAITMLPMLVGTSSAMTMAFAFAIFGKKRRDEQPPAPDEVLQANAARGYAAVPGGEVANGVVRVAAVPAPLDLEAGMPRWRRPSLLEARKADPTRSMASSQRMSFDNGVVGAVEGRECRVIRYAVVRLLDAPDELRSAEIGQLDQGDEVQLIERSGSYWLVLCPDGRQGWLHKMTLGEIVTDAAPTGFGRDIDDDVLSAFLTARARA